MDLRQLEYFVAVAAERSFTRGAERVHVVQSAVSAGVARLEREVHLPLFERVAGQPVHLTEAGRALLADARVLLATARRVRERMATLHDGRLAGEVIVGTVLSTGSVPFAEALTVFHRDHPDVRVKIRLSAAPVGRQLQGVVDGTFDLAVVPVLDPAPRGVAVHEVGSVSLQLACRADDPLATARQVGYELLWDRTFIDFPEDWGNRLVVDAVFEAAGCRRSVAIEVVDVATALALVRGGVGLAFVPAQHLAGHADLVAVDLRDPPRPRRLGVAVPSDRPVPEAAAVLCAGILEQLELHATAGPAARRPHRDPR